MSTRGRLKHESRISRWLGRVRPVLEREGLRSLARRKLRQFVGLIAERSRVWRRGRRTWRADLRPVFLMVTHRLGGGTERHLGDLERGLRSEGIRPIAVRPGRSGRLLWEERSDRGGTIWCRESGGDRESIANMLEAIAPAHAHVHHSIGLPECLFELFEERGLTYDWSIHDFYTVCPRINLIGQGGRYCGEPDQDGCDRCLAKLGDASGRPIAEGIVAWRKRNGRRLAHARRVFAPSADVCRRLARYFPDVAPVLRPHPESLPILESLAAPKRADEPVRVAVIGTLVAIKGSERLLDCARDARSRGLALEFHVIGSTDRDRALEREGNVKVGGRYRESEVFERIAAIGAHLAFLPSECPESFMFALSIAMAARMFVVCFDLGTQADRVRAWGWGRPIGLELSPGEINDALIAEAQALATRNKPPPAPRPADYPDILMSYYDFTRDERERMVGSVFPQAISHGSKPHIVRGRDHALFH